MFHGLKTTAAVSLLYLGVFRCLWSGVALVEGTVQDDLYRLMDDLFTRYKPEVRPRADEEATFLYVALHLLSIQGLDEKAQELHTTVIVEALWYDEWLSWNPELYGNVSQFFYPQSKVWLPDLIIENSVISQQQLGYNMNLVGVENHGFLHWKPSQVIKTSCDVDVTYYPFDTQVCNIVLSTWMSTQSDIAILPHQDNSALVLDRYTQSGTWKLLSNSLTMLPNERQLTRIQFSLKLKRLRTFYVLNMIIPVLFLSFTASMVFFLPAEAGEKIGMGITVLLAYAVYLTIIADNMPQTSLQVSYLAVYLTLLLGLTAMGVVLAVVVLHIHHKPDDCKIGQRTQRITRKLRILLSMYQKEPEDSRWATTVQSPDTKDDVTTDPKFRSSRSVSPTPEEPVSPPPSYTQSKKEEITWCKVAETFDRVMFLLTSFLIVIITVVFLPILAFGS